MTSNYNSNNYKVNNRNSISKSYKINRKICYKINNKNLSLKIIKNIAHLVHHHNNHLVRLAHQIVREVDHKEKRNKEND
jgi:hypothetical protein